MTDLSKLDNAALLALVASLQAKVAAKTVNRAITFKVTEKGGCSLYGLGRFPVSLYVSQWEKLIGAVKDGSLEAFLVANADKLSRKDD